MSAVMTPSLGTVERLMQDWQTSDESLSCRIGSMLRDLARPGVDLEFTVHIKGGSLSVKLDPPPHRWLWDGVKMRRQG